MKQRLALPLFALFLTGLACAPFSRAPIEFYTPVPTSDLFPSPFGRETEAAILASFDEPQGCLKPPDDMSRVIADGHTFNRRTYAMLQHADTLYDGPLEITDYHLTQGSYTSSFPGSGGTHAGGGAVDLSVVDRYSNQILWGDVAPLVNALRTAGFAAWFREPDEEFRGSAIHIHAIAVGDPELSWQARYQLTGRCGYFSGGTGIPIEDKDCNALRPDRYGGPLVCQWMVELGYSDLR
jgi:hypothetical protein